MWGYEELDLNDLPQLLTIREVAEIFRICSLTVKRWGKSGKIDMVRINSRGDMRFPRDGILYILGRTDKKRK